MKENQWEVEYQALMDELQEMREMLEEEKHRADEMWKIISDTTEWRIEYAPYHPAMKDQYHATRMQPFSLLKYVETSYSSNSVPLK